MEVAAQIDLLHYSESKLEAEQASQIAAAEENIAVAVVESKAAVVVLDKKAAVVVVLDTAAAAVVVEDNGTPHHFVYTTPPWHSDSYTSE